MIYGYLCVFQLIVGSEDFDIRVFKGDELLHEINEVEVSQAFLHLYVPLLCRPVAGHLHFYSVRAGQYSCVHSSQCCYTI